MAPSCVAGAVAVRRLKPVTDLAEPVLERVIRDILAVTNFDQLLFLE